VSGSVPDASSRDFGVTSASVSAVTVAGEVAAVPFWWHSIDLGHGIVTPGRKSAELLAAEWRNTQLGDLRGKSVLDVGAWDGFFSFCAERLGASRVVALDHYVWRSRLTKECVPAPVASEDGLPGRAGFDLAHRTLGSRVEAVVADVATSDLSALGQFDVVLFLGVLYHLENPLSVLRKLRALTREVLVVETDAVVIRGYEQTALCEFYDGAQRNNDLTNWWSPNAAGLEGLCRAAGFSDVRTIVGPPVPSNRPHGWRTRIRPAGGRAVPPDATTLYYRHVLQAR
jgi:tRNA (mo5U34)-methyltransferase